MKAVWSWMLELCELEREVSVEEGAAALTDLGLEVEGIERLGGEVSGVVIAEVLGKSKHPRADKLTVVQVRDSATGGAIDVVCGASNVPEPGGRVVWAKPGARLPGGIAIAAKELKGVASAGMLCAEDELGISDDHEGIIVLDETAVVGADARDVLHLEQVVFDVSIPANRADCLGHLGLARELVAAVGGRVRPWASPLAALTDSALHTESLVRVEIRDPAACPRYIARIVDGLTVGPSPRWMQQRLRAVGVRPISNLVDVTNYVMFELGQPLHAFDYRDVKGASIVVQRAGKTATMKTLDDLERALLPDDLLICDGERPVALAGVMGGLDSEVKDTTTRVLLETASFEPGGIRRTARRLALHSESSHRFERGVDTDGAERASQRAAQLLAELGGGRVARGAVDVYPQPAAPERVSVRVSRASQLTGVAFTRDEAIATLARLQLPGHGAGEDAIDVEIPSFRGDLRREVDLIEELIRLRGYDSIPATLPATSAAPVASGDARPLVRAALTASGLSEAITFGFTSPARIAALRLPAGDRRAQPIALQNPMSLEQSVMRTSLLANLLGAVSRNRKYGVRDVGLFEVGTVFLARADSADGLPDESLSIAAVLSGRERSWIGAGRELDFFDLKGALERLGAELAVSFAIVPTATVSFLHPGVAGEILVEERPVGVIGEVHPETRAAFEIDGPVFAFELSLPESVLRRPRRQMRAIPNHPAVSRDLSFFVDAEVPAARVREVIAGANEPLVANLEVLEDFRDPKYVPAGKKGMLWSITYRAPDRTLTDREVDAAHEPLVDRLLRALDAQRR